MNYGRSLRITFCRIYFIIAEETAGPRKTGGTFGQQENGWE